MGINAVLFGVWDGGNIHWELSREAHCVKDIYHHRS